MARFVLALACSLLALGGCQARRLLASTAGETLNGYKFASDVSGYLAISTDVCDIAKALGSSPPDYAAAEAIYAKGKNSYTSSGAKRTLKGWATTNATEEPAWGLYARHFNSSTWLHDFISAALAGGSALFKEDAARVQAIKKTAQSGIQASMMLHELDEAAEKVEKGLTDKDTGAPHNVDEAWAIYAGSKSPDCNLWAVPEGRETFFSTAAPGTCLSNVNTAIVPAFNALQAAALAGNSAAYEAAYAAVLRQLAATYLQTTLQYAWRLEDDVAKADVADIPEHRAEGWTFFRTIEPLVAAANATTAARVVAAFESPAPGLLAEIMSALESAYGSLNVTAADVGKLNSNAACKRS